MSRTAKTDDVPENFAHYAAYENDSQLGERFSISRRQAARMRKNLGIQSHHPWANFQPVPEDFSTIAGSRNNAQVAQHYGVTDNVVQRWRKESGVRAPAFVIARQTGRSSGTGYRRIFQDNRPVGLIADATDFLRRKGFAVYNRVVEDKKLDGQYVVGRMKFDSADAMIDYARSRGMTA